MCSCCDLGLPCDVLSYPNFRDVRDRNKVFTGMLAYRFSPLSLSNKGVNERIWGYLVTGNYFELLGVKPALGRFFTPADDRTPGAHPVAVLTYDCWQKRFAADPQVIGKTVIINSNKFTVIGVASPGFSGVDPAVTPDVFVPMRTQGLWEPNDRTWATGRRFVDRCPRRPG